MQADLVLLTDGQARLDPEVATTVRHFTARGLRLITVLLGEGPMVEAVAQWSTQVLTTPPTLEGAATILTRMHQTGGVHPYPIQVYGPSTAASTILYKTFPAPSPVS